jgi:uncharacterized membrane protein
MTLTTVNRLIGTGLAIPVAVGVWSAFSSNPYMVIAVAFVAASLSFVLIFTGTLLGGVKVVRGGEQPRTRDLFFLALGANVLLLALAVVFVIFGGKGA